MSAGRIDGNRHRAEALPGVRAVELGRFEQLGGHALDGCREHDHRETGLHPDQHDDEREVVPRPVQQELLRLAAEPDQDLVEQTDLLELGTAVGVHEPPDDARADERDRHRHEDQELVDLLAAGLVDEHRVGETDDRRERRHEQHPDDRVDDRGDAVRLREDPEVVGEPDEVVAGRVPERRVDGLDRRQDEAGQEQQHRRSHEGDELDQVSRAVARAVVEEEEQCADERRATPIAQ